MYWQMKRKDVKNRLVGALLATRYYINLADDRFSRR